MQMTLNTRYHPKGAILKKLYIIIPSLILSTSLLAGMKSRDFRGNQKTNKLSDSRIAKHATTKLQVKDSQIYFDNDLAFDAKIKVIDHAVDQLAKGPSDLYLNYYIFNSDESSSYLATKLIEAANKGVKVHITLDMLQAYPRLDFYRWMNSVSPKGNMNFYFYGRPTKTMKLDAVHLASPCIENGKNLLKEGKSLTACADSKKRNIRKTVVVDDFNASKPQFALPSLLLSGIYSKNPKVIVKAMLDGNNIELSDLTGDGSSPLDEKTKASLMEFVQVVLRSKFSSGFDKLVAAIELKAALNLYKDDLQPLYNLMTGLMPLSIITDSANRTNSPHAKDWAYLTDYTHHKIILSNDIKMVTGGRNIENSYHMQFNDFSKKYIFMDTDMGVELSEKNTDLSLSQQKIHNFKALVVPMDELLVEMPNDLTGAMKLASKTCPVILDESALEACVNQKTYGFMTNPEMRLETIGEAVIANAKAYVDSYEMSPQSPAMSVDADADVYYLENLHFDRNDPKLKRIYGVNQPSMTRTRSESRARASKSKAINELWLRAMEDQCRSKEPTTVYIYNAYFLPSGNFIQSLNKMIDGSYRCSNLTIKIITNSIETTDLGVINIFARHWLKAFSDYYLTFRDHRKGATIRYYEYSKEALKEEISKNMKEGKKDDSNLSLHSKVMVFGDDSFIVGSANADIRSYARDTNNAMFVRSAPKATSGIVSFIERRISDSRITEIPMETHNIPMKQIQELDVQTLTYMNMRRCIKNNQAPGSGCEYLNEARMNRASSIFLNILARLDKYVSEHNYSLLTFGKVDKKSKNRSSYHESEKYKRKILNKQRRSIDQYDAAFGVL